MVIRNAFRKALTLTTSLSHHSLNPNRTTFLCLHTATASLSLNSSSTTVTRRTTRCNHFFTLMAGGDSYPTSTAVEKQFDELHHCLVEFQSIRDRFTVFATEIESARRRLYYYLHGVYLSRPIPEVLEKANSQIDVLKQLFSRLAEIVPESPGQSYKTPGLYYRYEQQVQQVVSLLAFTHWLETESLITYSEVEEKLELNALKFGLDLEDYLIGLVHR